MHVHPGSLKGQFIMAMPGLADPNFFQTVTCISEHNENGAIGIVINRVHALISAKDIFDELKLAIPGNAEDIPVHIGGPVHIDEVFVLHGPPFGWEGCLPITDTLALSNTMDLLSAVAEQRGPRAYLVSLGCAGWGGGQLEAEILENAWLTAPVSDDIIFDMPVDYRWENAIKRLGIDPASLSGVAGTA